MLLGTVNGSSDYSTKPHGQSPPIKTAKQEAFHVLSCTGVPHLLISRVSNQQSSTKKAMYT